MNELTEIMKQVLTELENLNANLDSIRGGGSFNTLYDKLENINDSIGEVKDDVSNVYDKLDSINDSVYSVKDGVTDVYDKLDTIDSSISDVESAVNSVESSINSLDI